MKKLPEHRCPTCKHPSAKSARPRNAVRCARCRRRDPDNRKR